MKVSEILKKAMADEMLVSEEIGKLFSVPLFGEDSALIIAAGRRKSATACGGLAEVHAQVGLNIAPCPRNCLFCAFAAANKVFKERSELSAEEAVTKCVQFEHDGANAIFVMATADYSFGKFIEIGQEIRRALKPATVLIANVGDFSFQEAKQLKSTGFSGIYHAVRLGEGRDTTIPPQKRLDTFRHAKEAGLILGTCLEPVGNEHSLEELIEKTIITRDAEPCYSGAARRILISDTHLAQYGMVSEAKMAHIIAVVRLVLPLSIPGNCTHEPNVIGAAAGANLLWAEVGSNPRDTTQETEAARGMNVADCRNILGEGEWRVLDGPSKFYSGQLVRLTEQSFP